ncbi:epithelial cell-transforming sequence 2 oncogene-like [Anaeramoeba flamelloides]|uniref:Epithelial cell-transforming sequence 2 oncogene-like n=1 Tax=Anaeramoeba flamelloides TaxID=1746091 RepID=A0ABQ8XC91_9EUKA|nr:epithelial cell-transforming sequence 2 oncogene-like [Anaeramoeba flamelloides]
MNLVYSRKMENLMESQFSKKKCLTLMKTQKKKQTAGLDFMKVLPEEISLKVFSYLDPKTLGMCNSVSQEWNRITNDDLLWHEKSSKVSKTFTRYRSGWKALYFAKQKKEELNENSQIFMDVNAIDSFKYFSGNSCSSHNHPSIFAHHGCLNISGKGIYLEIPTERSVEALNLYAMLLKKRKYHPKFRIGQNNNYDFSFDRKERMIKIIRSN